LKSDNAAFKDALSIRGLLPYFLLVVAIGLFLIACSLPVFHTRTVRPPYPDLDGNEMGITILLFGWASQTVASLAWFANPLLFVAWSLMAVRVLKLPMMVNVIAFCCALIALVVSFSAFTLHEYYGANFTGVTPVDTVLGYEAGFYFWFASIFMTLFASLLGLILASKPGLAIVFQNHKRSR
jgi:hypothetical protein